RNHERRPGARRQSALHGAAQGEIRRLERDHPEGTATPQGRATRGGSRRGRRHRARTPAANHAPGHVHGARGSRDWLTEAAKLGAPAHSTLLDVVEIRPPADVASALALGDTEVAVLRHQILSIDGEPVEQVKSYYPLSVARDTAITAKRKIKGGTPTLLGQLGFPPRLSVDRVSARVPTQEQYQALNLPSDLPVLRTLRVVYSDDERPVEATVMVKAGHLYELQYEFTPA
ncbi:LOW QUALITY PROTEIN: regulatory protein KorSA, GntR-family transcriptional regulator, partial [Streptomyces griseoflavus Tu4000]